jgi:hypothetical protein
MSCNEWEKGTLKFSNTSGYRAFKHRIIDGVAQQIKKDLENANLALAKVKAAKPKGVRGFNWQDALRREFSDGPYQLKVLSGYRISRFMACDKVEQTEPYATVRYVDRSAPRQLTAKEAGTVSMKTVQLGQDGWGYGLSFDDANRSVQWTVSENNHACEWARESFLGELFFRALDTAAWGRSGGGVIVGNDEYNRDNSGAGGGGNYIKDAYGPAGKKQQEFETGLRIRPARRATATKVYTVRNYYR